MSTSITSDLATMLGHRFLDEAADSKESSGFVDSLQNNALSFFGYFFGGIVGAVLIYCIMREFIYQKFGHNCCGGHGNHWAGNAGNRTEMSRSRHLQYLDDQRLAADLQMEIEEEDRREMLVKKRKERRRKYEKFLLPYTMVVKKGDLCYAVEEERVDTLSEAVVAEENSLDSAAVKEGNLANTDLEAAIPSHAIDIDKIDTEVDRECLLKLPIKTKTGEHRHVDGECAICLLEYAPGDSVVWSTRRVCPHAYHDDCILVWLSKGKKRCPICRNFFVPGSSIDNKKVITHDEDDEEAYIRGSVLYEDVESDEDPLTAVREE